MTIRPGYEALAPFFAIIEEGLRGLVDGIAWDSNLRVLATRGPNNRDVGVSVFPDPE